MPDHGISQYDSPYNITHNNSGRKKILIFSCKAGGGHISMSNALKEYLEPEFCVGHTHVFSEILHSIDPVHKFTNTKFKSIDAYNSLLKRKWNRFLNFFKPLGDWYLKFKRKQISSLFKDYITKHKPDLIISVAPLINAELLEAAEEKDIPFLLIPPDLDASGITTGTIKKPSYNKFYLTLSYNNPEIFKTFKDLKHLKQHISHVGFPVKRAFLNQYDNQNAIKRDFLIPNNKPVILLMMGSQGSKEIYTFTSKLTELAIPAHLVIVLGKSEHMKQTLRSIWFPKHISHSIIGFTDRVADLMNISDVLITKSGSITVNEAIYAQIPMILDATSPVLKWEAFNHGFIVKYGLGKIIKKDTQLPHMVTQMLSKEEQGRIRKDFSSFDKKNPEQEIKLLVKRILFGENKQ